MTGTQADTNNKIESSKEREMARQTSLDAAGHFMAGTHFKRGNTQVKVDVKSGWVQVYLHGNLIAERTMRNTREFKLRLAGWNSRVTRERLNVLLDMAGHTQLFHQKDFAPYIDDIAVGEDQWVFFWADGQWGFDWYKPVPLAQMLESSK